VTNVLLRRFISKVHLITNRTKIECTNLETVFFFLNQPI
jgi:hypothetical protein